MFLQVDNHMKRGKYIESRYMIALTEMRSGYSGVVAEIHGGFKFIARLNSMGLMPGRRITKGRIGVSALLFTHDITGKERGLCLTCNCIPLPFMFYFLDRF